MPSAVELLKTHFGFQQFLTGQEAVIQRLLDGRSVLAVFPTGGGKSLCYQLPALTIDGLTLVISPLIALMQDQLDFLQSHSIPAARLDSSLGRDETLDVYQSLDAGQLKLLYVSPERLGNERFLHALRRYRIAMLAVDEAHCISQWGHNFRPDYLKIADLARELKIPRVLALTATATPDVSRDIATSFNMCDEDIINTGFYRPNLTLYATPCEAGERATLLLDRLHQRPAGPTIVYVTLQKTANDLAARLKSEGFDADAYHAGLGPERRSEIQNRFMASDRMIVVATIAFGMGIDKSNIRYVYHFNLPKSLESYSQEIGRAGRDQQPSICEMLACRDDVVTLENFSYGDTPTREAVTGLLDELLAQSETFDVSTYDLSNRYDMRILVVRTLLTYLELEGIIRTTGPFYSEYKFQPQRSSLEIFARFDAERRAFLTDVFRNAQRGKTWLKIDVHETSLKIKQPRDRIVAALSYLEEQGELILQATGVRQGYRLLKRPENPMQLSELLYERFLQRETQDIQRIGHVLDLAESDGCLVDFLLGYFGEKHGPCGHCGPCEGITHDGLPRPQAQAISADRLAAMQNIRRESSDALGDARQLTRFLCGLSSPRTIRARLTRHPLFGSCSTVPFRTILEQIEN